MPNAHLTSLWILLSQYYNQSVFIFKALTEKWPAYGRTNFTWYIPLFFGCSDQLRTKQILTIRHLVQDLPVTWLLHRGWDVRFMLFFQASKNLVPVPYQWTFFDKKCSLPYNNICELWISKSTKWKRGQIKHIWFHYF